MAAAVLFAFCTPIAARLDAAWGCLVHRAQSVVTPSADAAPSPFPTSQWYKLSRFVVCTDCVLSPCKLQDWRNRALVAEAVAVISNDRAGKQTRKDHAQSKSLRAQQQEGDNTDQSDDTDASDSAITAAASVAAAKIEGSKVIDACNKAKAAK